MGTKQKIKLNQEQIEKLVLEYLQSSYPDFKLKEATLETSLDGNTVRSWWVICDHLDGNESIMEDDQIQLLIQQQQGWSEIKHFQVRDTEQDGFILEMEGQ